jgi:hypothetical protein
MGPTGGLRLTITLERQETRVLVEQTTVVDPQRLGRSARRLDADELRSIDEVLMLVLALWPRDNHERVMAMPWTASPPRGLRGVYALVAPGLRPPLGSLQFVGEVRLRVTPRVPRRHLINPRNERGPRFESGRRLPQITE